MIWKRRKSNNSVIIPPVYIGKGVSINNSVIGPYVSIAEGCEINDCRIENTMIGKQCILSKSVIAESMIGNNVSIKSKVRNLSIGDYSVTE